MSIAQAEQLKTELTDKWVVVNKNIPELRRFAGMTGKVKTVNMNCQALVEFHGQEDIGWYDIGTSFLTVVDEPVAKPKAAAAKPAEKAAGGAKKPAGGGSPLDAIRKGSAGGAKKPAGGGSPLDAIRKGGAGGAKKPAAGGSPLDMIRKQGAAGKAAAAPAEEAAPEAAAETPAEAPAEEKKAPAADSGKKLSPIEMIRKQGPAKG